MKKLLPLLLLVVFLLSSCLPVEGQEYKSQNEPTRLALVTQVLSPKPPAVTPSASPSPEVFPVPVCQNETCLQAGIRLDYLIVTRPKFLDSLLPFVEWKSANGFRVGLVTVEWLSENYPGRHLAEQMKTGIHALHNSTRLKFVLLVGDTQMNADDFSVDNVLASYTLANDYNVPTGFYRRIDTDPARDVLASDAYFVEGRDWDPQNTGVNPRPDNMSTGVGFLNADFYLGRWPVREPAQVTTLIEKTKQIIPAENIFFSADTTLSDGVNSFCQSYPPSEFTKMDCYNDPMVTARVNFFEDNSPHLTTDSMFVDRTDSSATDELMEKILGNTGIMVLGYHGNFDCLGVRDQTCVSSSEFQFDVVFPLLEIEACLVGAFHLPGQNFSEMLLLSPTGPIILTQAPNPTLFLKELRDGKTAGEAFWHSAFEWLYFPNPIIFLGDPSLKVFIDPD